MLSGFIRLSLALSILMISACSMAPKKPQGLASGDYTYVKEYLSWLIKKEMKKAKVPAISIALVDDQRLVWSAGFGFADVEKQKPADGKTLYRAGSISKLFTATAAMQLSEQGLMDIDAPLQKYLPAFKIKSRYESSGPITPRTIMTHHSGLPDSRLKGMWSKQAGSFTHLVEQIQDDYVALPPDTAFQYSNLGFSLLGHAVAQVAEQEYAQYMDQVLLQPLHMHDSTFRLSMTYPAGMAKGYRDGKEQELVGLVDIPAGALLTSVDDLSEFVKMVFANGEIHGKQIIKPETLAAMLTRQNSDVELDFDLQTGLAWFLNPLSEEVTQRTASHAGGTLLYQSQLALLPDSKLGVVVMCNTAAGRGAIDKIASEALKLALESKTGKISEKIKKAPLPKLVDKLETPPFPLEGFYSGDTGLIEIIRDGKHYKAKAIGKSLYLKAHEGGWLSPHYRLLGFIPMPISELNKLLIKPLQFDGRQVLMVKANGKQFLLAEKINKKPIPASVKPWLGDLRIRNPDPAVMIEDIKLSIESGLMIISYRIPVFEETVRTAFMPVSDNEWIRVGIGRGMGETIKVKSRDGHAYLYYSGYEIVKAGDD